MTRAYNVIDADGHILEPLDLWDRYMDPEFRERRPRFVIDDNDQERLSVDPHARIVDMDADDGLAAAICHA